MAFDMYGDVILTRDVSEHGVRAGDVGTVVERHVVPGVSEEGYSVEFFDMTGNTGRCHLRGYFSTTNWSANITSSPFTEEYAHRVTRTADNGLTETVERGIDEERRTGAIAERLDYARETGWCVAIDGVDLYRSGGRRQDSSNCRGSIGR